jgi:hypothetical protein
VALIGTFLEQTENVVHCGLEVLRANAGVPSLVASPIVIEHHVGHTLKDPRHLGGLTITGELQKL